MSLCMPRTFCARLQLIQPRLVLGLDGLGHALLVGPVLALPNLPVHLPNELFQVPHEPLLVALLLPIILPVVVGLERRPLEVVRVDLERAGACSAAWMKRS